MEAMKEAAVKITPAMEKLKSGKFSAAVFAECVGDYALAERTPAGKVRVEDRSTGTDSVSTSCRLRPLLVLPILDEPIRIVLGHRP
jgi:hypothetical protein